MNATISLPEDLASAHHVIISQQHEIEYLREKMRLMQRQIFGRSSEKRAPESSGQQLNVFTGEPEEQVSSTKEESITYTRRKPGRRETEPGGPRFPEHLPRDVVVVNPDCPPGAEKIREEITEQLWVPESQYRVKRIVRNVYKDKDGTFIPLPPVPGVFDRCVVDAKFLAHMLVAKFCWHLPLYRQEQMLKAQGIKLSREAMIDYVIRSAEVLAPIGNATFESILQSSKIYVDETPVIVKKNEKQPGADKNYTKSYLWPVLGDQDEIVFPYTAGRAHKELFELIESYEGFIQCDGYSAYEAFCAKENATMVSCWAHVRRYFVDAEESDPYRVSAALEFIRELYKIEATARDLSPPERQQLRRERSVPVLKQFRAWLTETMATPEVLPKSLLCQACSYALERWESLNVYTTNGILDIDSNAIERQIRPVALGRKNWLFCASEVGAEAVAIMCSLIGSCKLQNINPERYLKDVLLRVDSHPADKVQDLLPRIWKSKLATT